MVRKFVVSQMLIDQLKKATQDHHGEDLRQGETTLILHRDVDGHKTNATKPRDQPGIAL